MISMRFKADFRSMIRIESLAKKRSAEITTEAAEMLVADIRSNWSAQSPSSVGNPPAVVTGNLDSSVVVDAQGRDTAGRFAGGGDVTVRFVRVDTSKGSNPGDRGNYAHILEDSLNRPFMAPAIERAASQYPAMFKRLLR
jgi:hypothetical protein